MAQKQEPVTANEVQLTPTKGSSGRGGGPGGEAWRVEVNGQRAGVVFINVIDEPPLGIHASLQIFLNKASQGRKIGRVAYRKAAEASRHRKIYAHMRKSNIASRRAAEEAGFVNATPPGYKQLIMLYKGGPSAIKVASRWLHRNGGLHQKLYTYVPAAALENILGESGLHSGMSLLSQPELLAIAAQARGQTAAEFRKKIKEMLGSWKAYSSKGPNAVFHLIPPTQKLSDKHPTKQHGLVPVVIDVELLLRESPETKLYGMELHPYKKENTKPRHGYLSDSQIKTLYHMTPEEYWAKYSDPEDVGYYAADVPHVSIHTPTGHIPSKYLSRL